MSVLIVGAGIAGLSCGYNLDVLSSGSVDLKILEARSKVGGRIQNVEGVSFIDFDLDLGGQDLFLNDFSDYEALLTGGEELDYSTVSWSPDDIDYCEKTTCQNKPFRTDLATASFVGESLANFVTKFLLPRVDDSVSLNTVVTTIDWSDNTKITVTTSDGSTYDADKLVVAVPLSQLKKNAIEFVPALPTLFSEAINDAGFKTSVRIFAEFSENFYDDATRVGDEIYYDASRGKSNPYCTDAWENVGDDCSTKGERTSCNVSRNKHYCKCDILAPIKDSVNGNICVLTDDTLEAIVDTDGGTCNDWCANLGSKNIITIRNGDMATMSDVQIREKLLDDLDSAYDGKARETFLDYYVINYGEEPYIEMATRDTSRNGNLDAYLQPVDGRIWFAGDYTRKFNNNVAGESGEEVAQFICACEDDPTWKREETNRNGKIKTRDCDYVAKKPNNRCRRIGFSDGVQEGIKAQDACPVACNNCFCSSN